MMCKNGTRLRAGCRVRCVPLGCAAHVPSLRAAILFLLTSAGFATDGLDHSTWSLEDCFDEHSIGHLLTTPELSSWLAYGPRPLTEMLLELGNCSTFSRGRFQPRLASAPVHSCHLSSCTRLLEGRQGVWMTPSRWRPLDDERPYRWYDTQQALSCLAGRVLVFRGDSMTRNVFQRLVWWLRGLPTVIAQPYHRHALYGFGAANDTFETVGEADVSDTAEGDHKAEAILVDRIRRAGDAAAMLVWIQYGDRSENSDSPIVRFLQEERSAGKDSNRPRVAGIISGRFAQLRLRRPEARAKHEWATEWLDLDSMNAAGGAPHYIRRDLIGTGDLGVLDADPHANQSRHNPRFWPMPPHQRLKVTTFDDTHFQCAFSPMWPGRVTGWKMPPNGDCRDLLSLNAVQAMLNRICNERI